MREFCLLLCVLTSAVIQSKTHAQANDGERPNVIVFLSDDQGWGDLSLNGNKNLSTPNIDSLARDGASFDRFYVCPVCSPTRAEFLTGRYHPRSGVYSTSAGGERMNLNEVTIADTFRAAGYRTAAFGKWHNGMQYPYHPCGRGFDEFYGFCSGHWGDYFSPPLEQNGKLVQGTGFCIDDFTDKAIEFMEQSVASEKPFFAYLPYNTPHSPMQVPDEYWEKFKEHPLPQRNRDPEKEKIGHTRAALAMCENIDWNVGRVLKKLESWGVDENTIVVYFCDNGPNGVRFNGGMKGRKGSTDEGGVRSPLLLRWPKSIPQGRQIDRIASVTDLLPTLADLAGIDQLESAPLDGKSLKPLLAGNAAVDWPNRHIVSFWRGKTSVRNQRFRLDHQGRLFDIEADPRQDKPVQGEHPAVVEALAKTAANFRESVAAGYDDDQRPFLLGNETFRYTQVPARDATYTGDIQRSNRYPNCSFLRNWTSTDETVSIDAVVAASGRYRVLLQYACPAEDLGATMRLQVGSSVLDFTISDEADPPLRGGENDRVERAESYVKDFPTIEIGTIELTAGEKDLTLKPLSIPGKQAMEFRLLQFVRE